MRAPETVPCSGQEKESDQCTLRVQKGQIGDATASLLPLLRCGQSISFTLIGLQQAAEGKGKEEESATNHILTALYKKKNISHNEYEIK